MVLMEAMGAALLCAPFFSTVCLAANALVVGGGSAAQRAEWLPGDRRRDDHRDRGARRAERALGRGRASPPIARADGGDVVLSRHARRSSSTATPPICW